jgi:hypothetical protein
MEAVKKLPMISFELKSSPDAASFHNLKHVSSIFGIKLEQVFVVLVSFYLTQ